MKTKVGKFRIVEIEREKETRRERAEERGGKGKEEKTRKKKDNGSIESNRRVRDLE